MVAFFELEAFGNVDDYLDAVRSAWGFEAAQSVREDMQATIARHTDEHRLDWQTTAREARRSYGPLGFLLSIPIADFLTAVDAGVGAVGDARQKAKLPFAINKICERRGVPHRMSRADEGARFEWMGDDAINQLAVAPALSALDDPRLARGAKTEFEGARDQLRRNTTESRKRAVAEACNAVESTMKVTLAENGRGLPEPQTLSRLVDRLVSENLAEGELKELLVAPGFFGNRKSRHGAGYAAHDVSEASALRLQLPRQRSQLPTSPVSSPREPLGRTRTLERPGRLAKP